MELPTLAMSVLIFFNVVFFISPILFYTCYAFSPALNATGPVSDQIHYGLDVLVKCYRLHYDIDLHVAIRKWFGQHLYRSHRTLLWAVV